MTSLEQLLRSRDERCLHQAGLMQRFPDKTLVCFTVSLPGAVKRDWRSLRIADAGVAAVRDAFQVLTYEELRDRETGFEGYFMVSDPVLDAKRTCCGIEDSHPLGRLMDLDVLEMVDGMPVPVSRERIGLEARRCLLCGRPARECMRSGAHSKEDLMRKIDYLLNNS